MKDLLSNDYRVQYYCGNSLNSKLCFLKKENTATNFLELDTLPDNPSNEYEKDLMTYIKTSKLDGKFSKKSICYCPRDRVELFETIPTLVKSRLISNDNQYSILMKLNNIRHFRDLKNIKKNDISFEKKKNEIIWRGGTTGYGFGNHIPFRSSSRETLIRKYCNDDSLKKGINVGLTQIVQEARKRESFYKQYKKPNMTQKELLEYKYILSVEGNDVATNLKWILNSNSVLLMPRPQLESWIMESHLVPYVHYVPIKDDFSNLEQQLHWCNQHQKECKEIVKKANEYIKIFLNENNEQKIISTVLQKYMENIWFINF